MSWDSQGRLWVVQYRQYPFPAGLKVVSYDQHLRAQFDKVPLPPPSGEKGADIISVLEDTDGDGTYDRQTDVLKGLNITTAAVAGNGRLWVLNPPYLLSYPDANGDALSFSLLTNPAHGSLSDFDPVAHTVRYTPTAGFNGTDSFTYTIEDADGDRSTTTLTFTVKDSGLTTTPDDPNGAATPGNITVNEFALASGSNAANTTETAAGSLSAAGGTGPYTYAIVGTGAGSFGTMTIGAGGSYSYTLTKASTDLAGNQARMRFMGSQFVQADWRFIHEYYTGMADTLLRGALGPDFRLQRPEQIVVFEDHTSYVEESPAHVRGGLIANMHAMSQAQRDFAARHGLRMHRTLTDAEVNAADETDPQTGPVSGARGLRQRGPRGQSPAQVEPEQRLADGSGPPARPARARSARAGEMRARRVMRGSVNG